MEVIITPESPLRDSLTYVNYISKMIEGNEYEHYLQGHLMSLKVELERQIRNEA
tara:strand:- start:15221 stop:15382 length:162 start_codon:yes stop_codon:yes gene_type:complete